MLENWSDKASEYWILLVTPFGSAANLILIYILLKHTPESTKTYASIILNITIADCLSLVGTFMASARVIPRDTQLFLIFRGACVHCFSDDVELKSKFCLLSYSLQVQCYILNHFLLIFSYVYRMLIITNPLKRMDRRKAVYIGLISYSFLHFGYFNWACYKSFQPLEIVSKEISKYEPDIVGSGATYNGVIDLREPSRVVFNFLSITSSLFVIVIATLCKLRIIRFSKQFEYSDSVKKLHQSLERVFSAQLIGPLLSFIIAILFLVNSRMGASTDSIIILENIMAVPAVLVTIVNPIVTCLFITPYRIVIQKWFHLYYPRTVRSAILSSTNGTKPVIPL